MKYLLLIVSILTIIFTSLVSIPSSPFLIGGMTQADISNMFSTSVTPAGITFAIWSIIYVSWIFVWLTLSWLPVTPFTKRFFPRLVPYLTDTHTKKNAIIAFALAIGLTAVWLILFYSKIERYNEIKYWDHICMDYHGYSPEYHRLDTLYGIASWWSKWFLLCDRCIWNSSYRCFLSPMQIQDIYYLNGIYLDTHWNMDCSWYSRAESRSSNISCHHYCEYDLFLPKKEIEKIAFSRFLAILPTTN